MANKKKRTSFRNEYLEINRRDNKGNKIFSVKGKPDEALSIYCGKFGENVDKRKKAHKELFKCQTKKKKLL